jgi:hypothetical protein
LITFRFFNSEQQDDVVALAMKRTERRFLNATSNDLRSALESQYVELEAWFVGDTQRLNDAVTRIQMGR